VLKIYYLKVNINILLKDVEPDMYVATEWCTIYSTCGGNAELCCWSFKHRKSYGGIVLIWMLSIILYWRMHSFTGDKVNLKL